MNKSFFSRWALPILCLVFFLTPFALRGARLAVERLENDVKDWLPPSFEETSELTWFGKQFLGEHFIVLTWEGCTEEDPSFDLLSRKLQRETENPRVDESIDLDSLDDAGRLEYEKQRQLQQARQLGNRLGLFALENDYENWGGIGEKWLIDRDEQWYFITPQGELYRWHGKSNMLGALVTSARRMFGQEKPRGDLVATLGSPPTATDKNDFHDDPRKLNCRLFNSLTTGPRVLRELSAEGGPLWPIGGDLSDEERAAAAHEHALERLKGTLYGPDGRQTCLVVTLTDEAERDLRRVIGRGVLGKPRGRLIQLAEEAGVTPPPNPPVTPFTPEPQPKNVLRLGGPPVDNVAIDEEGQITLVRLLGFSIVLGLGLAYLSFRSVKITLMVFFVGGLSALASLAMVYWSGGSVDAILMSMPSLVYVLGLSGAVHIVNYYRDAVRDGGLEGAPERALAHGWGPCTLAAITTALGLLSLCQSNILPIRKFGFYSALGVVGTLALLFTYVPAALQIWAPAKPPGDGSGEGQPGAAGAVQRAVTRFWLRIGERVIQHHRLVTAGCLVLLVAFAIGLTKIRTDVQLLKLFDANAKIIRDYTWLESHVGKLVPMELVAEVDKDLQRPSSLEQTASELSDEEVQRQQLQYSFLERLEVAAHIQEAVEQVLGEPGLDVVGRGVSAASFAPELPPASSYRSRLILNTKLEENRDRILNADYLAVDPATANELWRISLRLGALNDVDYGRFVGTLRQVVEPVLSAYACRDEALERLFQAKGDTAFRRARVCVLGLPNPSLVERGASSSGESSGAGDSESSAGPDAASHGGSHSASGPSEPGDASKPGGGAGPADAAPADAAPGEGQSPAADAPAKDEVDQTSLFATTLDRLFRARGFRSGSRSSKLLFWHDPQRSEPPEGVSYQDALREMLSQFDCIVLAADHPEYDPESLRQLAEANGSVLIDARQHGYQPGQPTAKDRNLPVRVTYTGVVPIVYKAQRTLLVSLIESIGWAFVMIAGVMMLVLRSGPWSLGNLLNLRGGLVSMLPNVFPVILVFGFMGHFQILVDIGTMMTASVAMGVAVDDTIHYLSWYRGGLARGLSRHDAILLAYRRVGPAMTQTTLIGGLGLSIFAFSTFTPTQRFGTMMLTLLVAALFGDLIFLPALLAGPLGKFFGRRRTPDDSPEPSTERAPVGGPETGGPETGGPETGDTERGGPETGDAEAGGRGGSSTLPAEEPVARTAHSKLRARRTSADASLRRDFGH